LLENYLEPLKRETFLSNAEINALFGNIQEIVTFQRQFLQNLDHAIEMEADFNNFDHPSQFKVCTFYLASLASMVYHFSVCESLCIIIFNNLFTSPIISKTNNQYPDIIIASKLKFIFLLMAVAGSPVFHWKCLFILRKSLQIIQLVLRQSFEGSESFTSK